MAYQLAYCATKNEVKQEYISRRYSIIICGSPRVGKSTLINAICGRDVAITSQSLNSCTDHIQLHQQNGEYITSDKRHVDYQIFFCDTPGVESWTNSKEYFKELIKGTTPICLIYCASPGSFASLHQLGQLVSYCVSENIFCALVCTNMWSGNNRTNLINEFRKLASEHARETASDGYVYYYDSSILCAMVNSERYVDEEMGIDKPAEGVDELISAITGSLNGEQLHGWYCTLMKQRTMSTKLKMTLEYICRKLEKAAQSDSD